MGLELITSEQVISKARHSHLDGANASQARRDTTEGVGRRRPKPVPLRLSSFVPVITATTQEDREVGQLVEQALLGSTFVAFTPTNAAFSTELKGAVPGDHAGYLCDCDLGAEPCQRSACAACAGQVDAARGPQHGEAVKDQAALGEGVAAVHSGWEMVAGETEE